VLVRSGQKRAQLEAASTTNETTSPDLSTDKDVYSDLVSPKKLF